MIYLYYLYIRYQAQVQSSWVYSIKYLVFQAFCVSLMPVL